METENRFPNQGSVGQGGIASNGAGEMSVEVKAEGQYDVQEKSGGDRGLQEFRMMSAPVAVGGGDDQAAKHQSKPGRLRCRRYSGARASCR